MFRVKGRRVTCRYGEPGGVGPEGLTGLTRRSVREVKGLVAFLLQDAGLPGSFPPTRYKKTAGRPSFRAGLPSASPRSAIPSGDAVRVVAIAVLRHEVRRIRLGVDMVEAIRRVDQDANPLIAAGRHVRGQIALQRDRGADPVDAQIRPARA